MLRLFIFDDLQINQVFQTSCVSFHLRRVKSEPTLTLFCGIFDLGEDEFLDILYISWSHFVLVTYTRKYIIDDSFGVPLPSHYAQFNFVVTFATFVLLFQ